MLVADIEHNWRIWGNGIDWKIERPGRQVNWSPHSNSLEFQVETSDDILTLECTEIGPPLPPLTSQRFSNLNSLNEFNFPINVGRFKFKYVVVDTGEVSDVEDVRSDVIKGLENFKPDSSEIDIDIDEIDSDSTSPSTPSKFDLKTPRLTFLGTGSSKPHSLRGPSSLLLSGVPDHTLLLDCGETAPTMLNILGVKRVDLVYITHKHLDHYGGIIELLNNLKCTCTHKRPLTCTCGGIFVVADEWMLDYIQHLTGTINGFRENFRVYYPILIKAGRIYSYPPESRTILNTLEFKLYPTEHCYDSTGCRLKYSGKDIAYTGDTRKCTSVINGVKGCDVLVHEATFKGDMKEDAVKVRSKRGANATSYELNI